VGADPASGDRTSDDPVDAETLAGWFGVTGKSVRELAERCMIERAGGSHARAEHTRSGRHRQRGPGKLARRGAKRN
jgi:hypothetical protein